MGRLRAAAPKSPLLVFTALDDSRLRIEAIALGAIGYLIKSASIQTLRDHIRMAIGALPGGSGLAAVRSDTLSGLLTHKQLDVLKEFAAGRSNREIATRMNIGNETVSSHLKEIFARLRVKNRTEAVIRYLELIDLHHDRPVR